MLLEKRMGETDKNGLVFHTAKGGPLDPHNVCRYRAVNDEDGNPKKVFPRAHFGAAVLQSGLLKTLKRVRFHDLRHTYGTWNLANKENSMFDVQKWMGHS